MNNCKRCGKETKNKKYCSKECYNNKIKTPSTLEIIDGAFLNGDFKLLRTLYQEHINNIHLNVSDKKVAQYMHQTLTKFFKAS